MFRLGASNEYLQHMFSWRNGENSIWIPPLNWSYGTVFFCFLQALIGVAFSIGFVFGPLIGAVFSRWARDQQGEFYVYPALFALMLAVADIFYVAAMLKETLPIEKRVSTKFL